jgi:alanine racemase
MAYITLNSSNLYHNFAQIAIKTGSLDKIAIVLKDNAYGHGAVLVARMASEYGIKKAIVRNIQEAYEIESYFDEVIVLGGQILPQDNFSFAINSLELLKSTPSSTKIELKIDTGMHRNGIRMSEIDDALEIIKDNNIELVGVMSHYASSDELGSEYFYQTKNFETIKEYIKSKGFANIRFHIDNSAGILRCKKSDNERFDNDLVRLGIGAYGHSHMDSTFGDMNLRPVMSLYANRVSSRKLKRGERIGYGGEFVAKDDMVVSTYDLGYGDGWRRGTPKNPYATVDSGDILGRVSMDFITLEGDKDEVCIMNDALSVARRYGTIAYEITCAFHANIERIVVE